MFRGMPIDRRSDYFTGTGLLKWEQGSGYTHQRDNPVTRQFGTRQALYGWLRKMKNRVQDEWCVGYDIDALTVTAWIKEII